jgi:UrcA family protein
MALVTLLALAPTAYAGPTTKGDTAQVTVRFADLDLGTAQGARTLYQRIRSAANSLCGLADGTDAFRRPAFQECSDRAVERAVRAVNRAELTCVHATSARSRSTPVADATSQAARQ